MNNENNILKIPISDDGSIIWSKSDNIPVMSYRAVHSFNAVLEYSSIIVKGANTIFILKDMNHGLEYRVFLRDFVDMIPHIYKGKVTGMFMFVKYRSGYGIKLIHSTF